MIAQTNEFVAYLDQWLRNLPQLQGGALFATPQNTALLAVDVINGFCHQGPLASPRVQAIIPPIVDLFNLAWRAGVPHYLLPQDTHAEGAVEFGAWVPHCTSGSAESETVPELKALPFSDSFIIFPKNSINSALATGLPAWLDSHPQVNTFVVTGDCTDLCTYQLAMHLRLDANARQIQRRVIVPANCVATYDLPLDIAQQIGAMPHPGDLLHAVFLYHMALNGIEVVDSVQA